MPTLFDDFVTPDSDAVVTGSITLVSPDLRDDGAGNTMTRIGYQIKVVAGHFAVTDVPAGPYIATWELFAGNSMMDASIGDGCRPHTVVVEAVSTPQRFRTLLSVAPVADSPASVLRQIVDDWLADNAPDDLLSKTVADATYALKSVEASVAEKYAKPSSGIPKTDLVPAVQTSLTAADNARARIFNVLDYGAKGDGTTDDYDAIQATVNAAAGFGVVYIPAGTYLLNKSSGGGISLPANAAGLTIRGDGKRATVIRLSKECVRAFDFRYVVDNQLFKNITLEQFSVDAANIGPLDIGPLTTQATNLTLPANTVTTVNVGSNAAWASKGLVYFSHTNAGTSATRKLPYTKAAGTTSININNDGGTARTLVAGDTFSGAIDDHVIVGTNMRGMHDKAWNFSFQDIVCQDVDCYNVPTIPSPSPLGVVGANFRGAFWLQPFSDPTQTTPQTMFAKRIRVSRCEAWGGECGFAVGTYGGQLRMFLDDILFEDLKHSAMVLPVSNYTGENYIIAGAGYGNKAVIRRCWGELSGDVGIETDAMLDVTVEDCVIEDSAGANYYSTNYNNPARTISGAPTATLAADCTSSATTLTFSSIPTSVARTGWITLGTELIYYTVTGPTTMSVTRGVSASTAAAHTSGEVASFAEVHRQQLRYRRCVSRHTRQGVVSSGFMPKGWAQYPGRFPIPSVSIESCEYENTMPEMVDASTTGGDMFAFYGETPRITINGMKALRHGLAVTSTTGYYGSLITVDRASAGGDPTVLNWKNVEIQVSGSMASGPSHHAIRFMRGAFILDWDSLTFHQCLVGVAAAQSIAVEFGSQNATVGGLIRRLRYSSAGPGDQAPTVINIRSSALVTLRSLTLRDFDFTNLTFIANATNSNYHPFVVDDTNKKLVTIEGTRHQQALTNAYGAKWEWRTPVTGNYTAVTADKYLGVNATAPLTITLPAITHGADLKAGLGKELVIKDEANSAATNTITVTPNGSETIDGATSKTITTNGGVLRLRGVPSGWVTV